MKNIDINTTQNVVLQYELAPLRDRLLAFFLDAFCIAFAWSIMIAFVTAILSFSGTAQQIGVMFLFCLFSFYTLAFEFFNKGRTLGKMAMKIKVIKVTGGDATFSDYAARWVFRLIDIYFSLGGIASILILSSAKAQRIGDIIANTAVVKTIPRMDIDLQDILAIHTNNKYIPKYLQAKKLHEHDALLIKATLERYRKFRNEAHREAVMLLSVRVKEILGIGHVAEENSTFLQTVLLDYVVLSR
jgi:uncharacterized RDD family membrane protein YckC